MGQIEFLFPTPVMRSTLDRKFTEVELTLCRNTKYRSIVGNNVSENTNILDQEEFQDLKTTVQEHVNFFFSKTINPSDNIQLQLTQSWLNTTEKSQYHHHHSHPNSFISGVLYISADAKTDSIQFFSNNLRSWDIPTAEYNIFNSYMWKFPVNTGDIILFPSTLHHSVPIMEGTHKRISLSFNTFLSGQLGSDASLTKLHLP